ncbi:MAG TPA: PepSY-associated TM helix domain-containing protein [Hymenobacter sp.]|uniref:PepSY-associated TM helix domain-containing protein n=1 Tax=Hymenobacter sp. TaxID=1898978 RepID=UPI002D7E19FA|nr:PepSY-associated TM helix domain-containing protein [Hymenobacter sp.]HET9502698.1 PepSY-associated TM helix domain-containing protein [Hymenobacter sp.]
MKLFFRRIHLYLGLVSGLFLVVVCLTGTILVFEEELTHAFNPGRYTVEVAATPRLSLAQLSETVRAARPKAKINAIKVYADPARTVEIMLAGGRPGGPKGEGRSERAPRAEGRAPMGGPNAKGGKGGKAERGPTLFLNPYTGAILGEYDSHKSGFHFIEEIHRGLVAGRVGKLIMGINSIIFLFILGTGIVLWWPAAKQAFSQRLRIKWGSSWKRLNHDFHVVLGFYASVFLFIMAATGVGMSFDWVGQTINTLTHSPQQRLEPPTSAAAAPGAPTFRADAALALARRQDANARSYTVQLPKEPTGSIQVGILPADALTERATNDTYLDQHTGQVLRQQPYAEKPVGQRIRGFFKPVHTGAIFGWPTKVLAFVFTLLGVTFPITGTIMWLNRTRKTKKKPLPRVASVA